MRAEIANLVYPVIRRGLSTHERLAAGEAVDFEAEQAALKALLASDLARRGDPEFSGDRPGTTPRFLGIRYALASWLDDVVGGHPNWRQRWADRSLIAALFGGLPGNNMFWEQAELALQRAGTDAAEAFFLCVHLDLGGNGEAPERARAFLKAAGARLAIELSKPWPAPPAREFAGQAPPLRQRRFLRRALALAGIPLTVFIPIVVWLVARRW